ncbi:toxin-antitoxin system YwqK family antitoxin [Acanthopleuribacter pedis]|uniref:Toxin-antitoxin system YwqK family antitoxin n=1 Tax=Acanthopleuribacter pedis TaxID=442870 RepID=A0A8J7QP06_9BACT|nr:hypothetical protein [Acanthopleuribacter pedis]MBO1322625.1 hypothetical protein [Acanthopleuribacter pedis]
MPTLLLILLSLTPTPTTASPLILTESDARLIPNGRRLMFLDQPFSGVVWRAATEGNGRLVSYHNGLREGLALSWRGDGGIATVRRFAADRKVGTHLGWWPDRRPRFVYHFENGLTHGPQHTYYADGRPATAYHFIQGRETGAQKAWTRKGELVANYVVRNGRRYGLIGAKPCYTTTAVTQNIEEGRTP